MAKITTYEQAKQEEMDLVKQLEAIRATKLQLAKASAEKKQREVAVALEEVASMITDLKELNVWQWGNEHQAALQAMGLVVAGPKPVVIDEEFAKKLVELLKGKDPQTLDQIATLAAMKKSTVRIKMGPVEARGDVVSEKRGVTKFYTVK